MSDNQELIDNLKNRINEVRNKYELSKSIGDDYYEPGMMENLNQYYGDINLETGEVIIKTDVKGLRYENRSQLLEMIRVDDQLKLVRDPENVYNSNNLNVLNMNDELLGTLSAELCNAIAPLYDLGLLSIKSVNASYIEQLIDRSRYAKQGILFVEIKFNYVT